MWEDVDEDEDEDDLSGAESDHADHPPDNQLAYGDTEYELVLPSGARIGHRSMMRYYAQSFHGIPLKPEDPNSGAALVRRLLADKHSALVPRKAGFGAFGLGTQVVKARNKGEAREAGRHIREFRDQQRREAFKTKVGFVHNNQKHFRDPLLQVRFQPFHLVLVFTHFLVIGTWTFSDINMASYPQMNSRYRSKATFAFY